MPKKNRLENNRKAYTNVTNDTFIQWDEAKIDDFSTLLSSKINEFAQLENLLQDPYCDTDSISRSLSEILVECSHSVFGCTRLSRNNSYQQCKKNTWFNQECYEARKNFKKARNAFNKNKQNAILRQNYLLAKQSYNSIIRREKVKYGLKEKTILSDLCKKTSETILEKG